MYSGYSRCGRLYLTNTPEGEVSLKRMFSRATIFNEAVQMYDTPEEMRRWFPENVKTDDIKVIFEFVLTEDCCCIRKNVAKSMFIIL